MLNEKLILISGNRISFEILHLAAKNNIYEFITIIFGKMFAYAWIKIEQNACCLLTLSFFLTMDYN